MTPFRFALRSLVTRPVRSTVLACGFGFGIAVMAALLGVGEVILEQASSPALAGGGDLVLTGAAGPVTSTRFVLSAVLGSPPLAGRARASSPGTTETLFLVRGIRIVPVRAHGGIPSLEKSLGDAETSRITAWSDAPGDERWSSPEPADLLRAMDRFHPIGKTTLGPEYEASWAEWLYFNGSTADGTVRFYLTFLVGPLERAQPGARLRSAIVRLQLDRGGRVETYFARDSIPDAALLAGAPDLEIGRSRVQLEGLRYRIHLDLPPEGGRIFDRGGALGDIVLEAEPGQSVPPFPMRGAGGWVSGYVVPVLSGRFRGALDVGSEMISLEGATGYHDHNWGFWHGVTWQWGQVAHDRLSIVYGRIHPPPEAADPERVPGFLGVLGPGGPLGFSTDVTIEEIDEPTGPERRQRRTPGDGNAPSSIRVHARSAGLDLTLSLDVEQAVVTRAGRLADGPWASLTSPGGESVMNPTRQSGARELVSAATQPREAKRATHPERSGRMREDHGLEAPQKGFDALSFLQLRVTYHVTGKLGDVPIDFKAPGTAETFRRD